MCQPPSRARPWAQHLLFTGSKGLFLPTPDLSFHVECTLPVCLHLAVSTLSQKVWKEDLDMRSPVAPLHTQRRPCTLLAARGGGKRHPSHSACDRGARGAVGPTAQCRTMTPPCPPVQPPSPTSASLRDKRPTSLTPPIFLLPFLSPEVSELLHRATNLGILLCQEAELNLGRPLEPEVVRLLILKTQYEVEIINPRLPRGKLRHKAVKPLARGTVMEQRNRGGTPALVSLVPRQPHHLCCPSKGLQGIQHPG